MLNVALERKNEREVREEERGRERKGEEEGWQAEVIHSHYRNTEYITFTSVLS